MSYPSCLKLHVAILLATGLACTTRPLETETETGTGGLTSTGATDGGPDPTGTGGPGTSGPGTTDSATDPTAPTPTGDPMPPLPSTTEPVEPPPDLGTGQPCDIWEEDCPEGQKCMPAASPGNTSRDILICVPIDPDPAGPGEPCENLGTGLDGLDNCGLHHMCWGIDPQTGVGTCHGLCTGTPDEPGCADPETICHLPADGTLSLCLPTCDPLQTDCGPGQTCVPVNDNFHCAPDLSGDGDDTFDTCDFINQCGPGFVCINSDLSPDCDPMQQNCCLPYCDLTAPDPCPGLDLACLAWFDANQAPPGLEDLGVCGLEP